MGNPKDDSVALITEWLNTLEASNPASEIVRAISETTKTGALDEMELLRRLREVGTNDKESR